MRPTFSFHLMLYCRCVFTIKALIKHEDRGPKAYKIFRQIHNNLLSFSINPCQLFLNIVLSICLKSCKYFAFLLIFATIFCGVDVICPAWESVRFASERSRVRIPSGPPRKAVKLHISQLFCNFLRKFVRMRTERFRRILEAAGSADPKWFASKKQHIEK